MTKTFCTCRVIYLVLAFFLNFLSLNSSLFAGKIVSNDFDSYIVDNKTKGPAYAAIADIDQDGIPEIIATSFGKIGFKVPAGELLIYKQNGRLDSWTKLTISNKSDALKFPNQPFIRDISGNGLPDIILPTGFLVCDVVPFGKPCGGLVIFEQTELGLFKKHTIVKPHSNLFFHTSLFIDLDGDGIVDLITVGERKAKPFSNLKNKSIPMWFKGTSTPPYFETNPRPLGKEGLGGLPVLYDLNGNGKMDIASAEYFHQEAASFSWFEQVAPVSITNPDGIWERHIIDDEVGPSIMFQLVEDLYGDGKVRGIGSNHSNTAKNKADPWESAIYVYDIPNNPREKWNRTKISSGIRSRPGNFFMMQAAPGLFGVGDLNGNGKKDIIVSGDGDSRVFWLEQIGPGHFKTHVLVENFGQAGSMQIADLDGDGLNEAIISSYESNEIYILKFKK